MPDPGHQLVSDSIAAILFDLDGVLIDSGDLVLDHWRTFADWYGLSQDDVLADVHGRRAVDVIRQALADRPPPEVEDAIRRHEELEVADTDGVVALPGASALLDGLSADRWAIVTACSGPLARARISAAGLPAPAIVVASEHVSEGKPAPDGYLAAASRLAAAPGSCVVIEDAPHGLTAGRAAGAYVLAVTTTHLADDLTAADVIVPDLSAVRITPGNRGLRLAVSAPVSWPAR